MTFETGDEVREEEKRRHIQKRIEELEDGERVLLEVRWKKPKEVLFWIICDNRTKEIGVL